MKAVPLIKRMVYFMAIAIMIVSSYILITLSSVESRGLEDLGEVTGITLAITMSFEMLLFFGLIILKSKILEGLLLKYFKIGVKYLRIFHRPVGALAISILFLHFSFTLNLSDLFSYAQLTGYLISAMVLISIIAGLIYKMSRKLMNNVHVTTSFAGAITFVIHIID